MLRVTRTIRESSPSKLIYHTKQWCPLSISASSSSPPPVVDTGLGEEIMREFLGHWKKGKAPEKFNFSRDVFDRHAKHRGSSTALSFDGDLHHHVKDRKWSFSEMQKESIRSAVFLRNLVDLKGGNTPNNPPYVLSILPRVPEWWFLHLAAIRVGTAFCPGTTMLTAEDILYRLDASRAKLIITDEANMGKVDEACKSLPGDFGLKKVLVKQDKDNKDLKVPKGWIDFHNLTASISQNEIESFTHTDTLSDEIAQGYFTSGTTGKPKMVAHTHASYGMGHYTTARLLDLKETDVHWNISDPGWAKSSYSNFFAPWIVGAEVFIHQMEKWDPKKILSILKEKPITTFCAPPTLYKSLLQEKDESLFKFKSLRFSLGAGEPVNPEVARIWKEKTGIKLDEGYGQTEIVGIDCQLSSKEGSIGIPSGFMEVKIVDENVDECPPGVEGQVAVKVKPVRPIGLFKGYLRKGDNGPEFDKEKNASVFVKDLYLLGDRGLKDESGHLFLTGRGDDVITSSGYRIGPTEIESVLQTHPGVVESAAVASPDPHRLEVVKAFIILTPEYRKIAQENESKLIKEIQDYVKQRTAPYKYPRRIEFVETLPKTISGKILRRELKRIEFEQYKESNATRK